LGKTAGAFHAVEGTGVRKKGHVAPKESTSRDVLLAVGMIAVQVSELSFCILVIPVFHVPIQLTTPSANFIHFQRLIWRD
jgi:hypothetical protein